MRQASRLGVATLLLVGCGKSLPVAGPAPRVQLPPAVIGSERLDSIYCLGERVPLQAFEAATLHRLPR